MVKQKIGKVLKADQTRSVRLVDSPKDGAERRRRFAQKLAMDQRRAAELFDELDEQCHGVITKAQVEVLLRNIVIRHHTFKQEALDYMWTLLGAEEFRTSKAPQEAKDKAAAAAKETQSLIDTTDETDPTEPLPMVEERLFSRVLVLDVVTKMRYYTCHAHDVDVIFEKFDRDKDNYLDANELREALQYIEDKGGNREKYGILIPVVVTSEDVRWVLAQCAHTVSGLINREEAVVAMAIWHHLADDNFAQQPSLPWLSGTTWRMTISPSSHGAAVSSEVREPTGPEPSSGSNDM